MMAFAVGLIIGVKWERGEIFVCVRVCQGIRESEICSGLRERFYYREREREKVLCGEKFTIKLNSVHLIVFL